MSSSTSKSSFSLGPGLLVTAAFIGPGTVITASMAGASFGHSLLWAILFAVFATYTLQSMTARLALVTGVGLGENLAQISRHPFIRWVIILLVASSIVIGNGAYQGGNIAGATLGLKTLLGDSPIAKYLPLVIGVLAFLLLWDGSYRRLEKVMQWLVGLMSLAFLATLLLSQPDWLDFVSGLVPGVPDGASLTVIALIGTTVVPYNLFLYASNVGERWRSPDELPQANRDLLISISLGGLITMAIISTAATAFFAQQATLHSASDLAPALEPLFGQWSGVFIGIGLMTAGLSSAITAPIAAAFALTGVLERDPDFNSPLFKNTWRIILLIGMLIAFSGYKPMGIIVLAQVANGLLLPLLTVFILYLMNSNKLGEYRNNTLQNALGAAVLLVTLVLSGRSLGSVLGLV